jgi:hypothetical protein
MVKKGLFIGALVALLAAVPAQAANDKGYPVVPGEYDPAHLGGAEAQWVTHEGLPDAGLSDHALVLEKTAPNPVVVAAYAELKKVGDTTWQDQIGFDRQTDSACTAGAPRFNVVTDDGVTHFLGCSYGDHQPIGNDRQGEAWERVRFTGQDAFPPIDPEEPVAAIYLIQDEQGRAVLDNVFYNGMVMGKPGNGSPAAE